MPTRLEYRGALNSFGPGHQLAGALEPGPGVARPCSAWSAPGDLNSRHRPKTASGYTARKNLEVVSFALNLADGHSNRPGGPARRCGSRSPEPPDTFILILSFAIFRKSGGSRFSPRAVARGCSANLALAGSQPGRLRHREGRPPARRDAADTGRIRGAGHVRFLFPIGAPDHQPPDISLAFGLKWPRPICAAGGHWSGGSVALAVLRLKARFEQSTSPARTP